MGKIGIDKTKEFIEYKGMIYAPANLLESAKGMISYLEDENARLRGETDSPLIHGLMDNVHRLEEENARLREAQRWIPVSERLPDDGVFVVVIYNGNELPAIAFIQENQWRKYPNWWIDHVTHWMPLPKPPEAA